MNGTLFVFVLFTRSTNNECTLETKRHSKSFSRFFLDVFFSGHKMHRYQVLSPRGPECVSRKDEDESRSRSTFRPWLQFQKSKGRAKTRSALLSNFNSSVDVINDDQSGKEMLLERGCCIPSFVTQCCCVWFSWFSGNEFDFSNDLYMHQIYSLNLLNVILELSVTLRFKFTSKL